MNDYLNKFWALLNAYLQHCNASYSHKTCSNPAGRHERISIASFAFTFFAAATAVNCFLFLPCLSSWVLTWVLTWVLAESCVKKDSYVKESSCVEEGSYVKKKQLRRRRQLRQRRQLYQRRRLCYILNIILPLRLLLRLFLHLILSCPLII